ncbi:MAG: ribose-5-phosphate isomerase RpiA [Methanotrichaceae archaeon]|nr:ribose-5-phosphate isomerase RpiA [Methanotrichaceae archaeon]
MKDALANAEDKRAAGEAVAALVEDGMVVGLGTGSTVAWTIRRLGSMVGDGLEILGVPTSYQAESLAIECGITLTTLSQHPSLDLAIDGADQVDEGFFVIKGGGAAHAREKVVAYSARRFAIVADASKYVPRLDHPVPLEVLPFAAGIVSRKVEELGGRATLRQAKMKDGPVITDNGNFIVDADFGEILDPSLLANRLSAIPGLVEHGIFENLDRLYIARSGEVEVIDRPK